MHANANAVDDWVSGVRALARIAKQCPQTAYTEFTVLLQAEWQHAYFAVPGEEALLQPMEDAIVGKFVPTLLDIQPGKLAPALRGFILQ